MTRSKRPKRLLETPNIHTDEGFQIFNKIPITEVEQFFAQEFGQAFDHFWDAMWISRVMVRRKCEKLPCPKLQNNPQPWGEADICQLSIAVDKTLRVFIEFLVEKLMNLYPPPIYPDLIALLKQIQADLQKFTQQIDPDEEK